ncbi:glycosyltransferase family 2 protein [Chitinophaga sp. YIM B06452]|uniref:glycosyltransferase family 2 protein n=1 Tax=Chitinophaga sp. YIM B06452 TaxID=3082158 RepID=UPI0031FEFF2A
MNRIISVITVVYNDVSNIEATIQNVLMQDYAGIEYIVIDGGSTDGTVDVIRRYSGKIRYWVSEKDRGIYDAMNKGIKEVSGEYAIFMNSGDKFFNPAVISSIFNKDIIWANKPAVIYGNTCIKHGPHEVLKEVSKEPDIFNAMPFCHQSVFISAVHLKKYLFNLDFKIIADREMITRMFVDKCGFHQVKEVISIIQGEGYSNLSRYKFQKEENRMLMNLQQISPRRARISEKKAWIKDLLANFIPDKLIQYKRKYKT